VLSTTTFLPPIIQKLKDENSYNKKISIFLVQETEGRRKSLMDQFRRMIRLRYRGRRNIKKLEIITAENSFHPEIFF